jgi:hypothetical protein
MIVSLNIPDASATQIVEGVCAATGWTVGSGKTKADWAKAALANWAKETAKRGLLMQERTTITAAVDPIEIT